VLDVDVVIASLVASLLLPQPASIVKSMMIVITITIDFLIESSPFSYLI
jgi:hypothetical protein